MGKALSKMESMKGQFGGMMKQFGTMMGMPEGGDDLMMSGMAQTRELTRKVNAEFKNPDKTTFVCVCIPEFLSLYETERLVQELTKFEIDPHNIVCNQVIFPEKDIDRATQGQEERINEDSIFGSCVRKIIARQRMQRKYIDQIYDL